MKSNLKTLGARIALCASVLSIALSFSGTAFADTLSRQLSLGMSGSDVSSLQTFLASDPSVYPSGLITGYFGALTQKAVSAFQTKNGLPAVGRVGPQTLALINSQMGGTSSGGSTGGQIGVYAPAISNVSVSTSTSGSAVVNWSTNKLANGVVYYSTSPLNITESPEGSLDNVSIVGTPVMTSTNFVGSQSVNISGLQPATTYYYTVLTKDQNGYEQMTWPSTFRTI